MDDPLQPHPVAAPKTLAPGITLLPPLSRRGHGPGIVIILPSTAPSYAEDGTVCNQGVPPPLLKWAEEGFAVVQILENAFSERSETYDAFGVAIAGLKDCKQCLVEYGIGLLVYDVPTWNDFICKARVPQEVSAVVFYARAEVRPSAIPAIPNLFHLTGVLDGRTTENEAAKQYNYCNVVSPSFAIPGLDVFEYATEAVSHTRNLTFIKKYIRGADFDLEKIWEEHTYYEFECRSVAKTMSTMVQEPYVNHVPTITGGLGRDNLSAFYRDHFIFSNPRDTRIELISRTIGIDRVCDEFVFNLTHDSAVDWLLPGIPPTGRKLRIAFTSVVNIRGDRLYHEHISWDQASVLVQLGLMPEYLPWPYPPPDGSKIESGDQFEYKVPATGVDTALKMLDKNAVASNDMFANSLRRVNHETA